MTRHSHPLRGAVGASGQWSHSGTEGRVELAEPVLFRLLADNSNLPWSPGGGGGHSLSPDAALTEGTIGRKKKKNQAGFIVTDMSSQLLERLRKEDYSLKAGLA